MDDLIIEKPSVEGILGLTMKSGLGLDISKNSTGVAIYKDGVLKTYQVIPEFDEEDDLRYYYMVKSLEDDFSTLVEGCHFDIIAIEDAIQGVNFHTDRLLILLNSVIDRLIGEGKVTCDYFRRIENTKWKKWLRTLRPVKKYETDKIEIENTMLYLGYDFALDGQNLSKSEKEKMGYQDQLDAIGVLIGAGLERLNSKGTVSKSKKQFKQHVELYSSLEDIRKKYKNEVVTEINLKGNLKSAVSNFFKNLPISKKMNKYYFVTDSIGTLGLEYGLRDLPNRSNYILIYQTVK